MSLIDSFVEVTLADPQDFLKVRETLTRIGVSSKTENKLYQSCHILHKRGKWLEAACPHELDGKGLVGELPEAS